MEFIDRVLPESFKKLLTSSATLRWGLEIQEGIYDMLELFIALVIQRLKDADEVPVALLDILAVAFDIKSDWNQKNRDRSSRGKWESRSNASTNNFAHPPRDYYSRSQFGWLCDLINLFGDKGGFELVYIWFHKSKSASDGGATSGDAATAEEASSKSESGGKMPPSVMASLLAPVANCVDMLERDLVQQPLWDCAQKIFADVATLEPSELKGKEMTVVSDLLVSTKLLSLQFWPQHVDRCDQLRLEIICKMLKTPQV